MKVEVHLHTILQRETPDGLMNKLEVELSDGSTLADLLEKLEITMNIDSILLVINGRAASKDRFLSDNDVVNLIPAISGG